jgi:glycosyltransferase involved in cell wall biosynthesis
LKVLWLGHNLAYPPKTGPLQRNYNLLREVARQCQVHFLAFDQPASRPSDIAPQDCINALSEFCCSADWVPLSGENRYWLAARGLASGEPYEFRWLRSPVMAEKLRRCVGNTAFDVVHFDTLGLAQYRRLISNSATVLNHHDIQSSLIARRSNLESNFLLKRYWRREGKNLQRTENEWCPKFDVNLVVSNEDGDLLQLIAPESNVRIVPNGVDISYFTPRPDPGGSTLLFCGSLDMYPNREAMNYFFDAVWPKVITQFSSVQMYVVGRNPPPWLLQLSTQDPRIHVTGFVDDIRPYFRRATAFVCPIRDGGGTRLKILDSIAMGVPVIGTSFACSGLNLEHQKHVLLADTPDEFVRAVGLLLSDKALRARLAASGAEMVQKTYSWEFIGQSLVESYRSVRDVTTSVKELYRTSD